MGKVIQFRPKIVSSIDAYRVAKLNAEKAIAKLMLSSHPESEHYKNIVVALVAREMANNKEKLDPSK